MDHTVTDGDRKSITAASPQQRSGSTNGHISRGDELPVPRLVSRACEGETLVEVVSTVNATLESLRSASATILSVTYALDHGERRSPVYLGSILYRLTEDHAGERETGGRLLPFRRRETTDLEHLVQLAHQASAQAPVAPTREERAEELRQQTATAIERLAEQLAEGHSDRFRAYLAFAARFWEYSAHNALLILLQRPEATHCAGMRLWNQMGYTVRKGERGIWIWAPMLRRGQDERDPEQLIGFRPAVIFDASQLAEIDDQPLPSPVPSLPDDVSDLLALCTARIREYGISVTERRLSHGTAGLAGPGGIVLNPGGDSRNRLFVLLHELAHMLGHVAPLMTLMGTVRPDDVEIATRKQEAEFEAEAAAFAVSAILGLEHPGARDYLLHYRATPAVLTRHLSAIQRIVQQMLSVLGLVRRAPRALHPGIGQTLDRAG